jgi:hypothetical protein
MNYLLHVYLPFQQLLDLDQIDMEIIDLYPQSQSHDDFVLALS